MKKLFSLLFSFIIIASLNGCTQSKEVKDPSESVVSNVEKVDGFFNQKTNQSISFDGLKFEFPQEWKTSDSSDDENKIYLTPNGSTINLTTLGDGDTSIHSNRNTIINLLIESGATFTETESHSVGELQLYFYEGNLNDNQDEASKCTLVLLNSDSGIMWAMIDYVCGFNKGDENDFYLMLKTISSGSNNTTTANSASVLEEIKQTMGEMFSQIDTTEQAVDESKPDKVTLLVNVNVTAFDDFTANAFFTCSANAVKNSAFASSSYQSLVFSIFNTNTKTMVSLCVGRDNDIPTQLNSNMSCLLSDEQIKNTFELAYQKNAFFSDIDSAKQFDRDLDRIAEEYGIKR